MTVAKKNAKKVLDDARKKAKIRHVEIDQMSADWTAMADATDDPLIAACYREQAGTIARIGELERESMRLNLANLEREAAED